MDNWVASVVIFCRSGYEKASKNFDEEDLKVDCTGYHFMITGANSGIGKCVTTSIAERGGTIHMVCRNETAGNETKLAIMKTTGNEDIHVYVLDLSQSLEVVKFCEEFRRTHDSLNVLVNNAGCMINQKELTEEGLEKNFATNTLGMHLLTTGLVPLLQKSKNPRVVTVSSGGMLVQKLKKDDLQFEQLLPFDGTMAYAQNKRQQVVLNEQYAKKYPEIHFSCMHPGWAATPAVKSSMPEFYEKMKDRLRSPEQGADTVVWLAIGQPILKMKSGLFFQDRRPVSTHLPLACTKVSAEEEERFVEELDKIAQNLRVERIVF
ncbi:Dehydrogenase/reductase SDR family member 12 [Armadillidium nasatum]|uniref:Dehydrogenase/reductase SDR family member 12 n=1 Tax=Armadillidium nasatum TaxID=96803 RepID=A0A5N5TFT9_9CRUS|nr:Dehydrogenase/reductase SDR family member 12 [Armadillidium nasatum]